MPGLEISIEDDPTPLVRGISVDLRRRLQDPGFGSTTAGLRGSAAVRVESGPEAATIELTGATVVVRHGASGAQVAANLGSYLRWDGDAVEGQDEYPELARWLSDFCAPSSGSWRDAAALLWAELEGAPGAPGALLVADLDSGDAERFGDGSRAYEIRGRGEPLLALLEGRASLLDEAATGRILIRGSFPEISVISGACMRVRMER